MGNYKYNTAIAKELSKSHEVYLLEQLNGKPSTPEYENQILGLDPDIVYFDMLDLETFKILEKLKCIKVLAYNTPGILGFDEIFDYKDKWFTHVYTNSLVMKHEFEKRRIPVDNYEWFLSCIPQEEKTYEDKYNHDCVFLGMGFQRVTNNSYQLERDLFFSGIDDSIDFKIYGNGWPQIPSYKGILPPNDIGKLYTSAKSGFAIIAPEQRNKGMINNRYSEMGICGVPIISYNYETIDWFGAENYINFVSSKNEAVSQIKDILLHPEEYKVKTDNLKNFVDNQHQLFFEKLLNLINI
jgi:hypothetical protein